MSGRRLDWLAIAGIGWLVTGLFLDGWAHNNRLPDSFWTVWHAIFYSGYAALSAVILGAIAVRRPRSASWRAAIPEGYGPATLGVLVFGIGGLLDMLWHTSFGVEVGNDALLSPSHLTLGLGLFLLVSGPYLADLARREAGTSLGERLPAALAIAATFMLLTFFTMYGGPYSNFLGASGNGTTSDRLFRGLLGMFLFSGFIAGLLLVVLRRTSLPAGAITLILGLDGIAMVLMTSRDTPQDAQLSFIAVAIVSGIAGDVLLRWLRPSGARSLQLRMLVTILPMTYFTLYLAVVGVRYGYGWTMPFLTGSVFLCGAVGLLLSFVAMPPAETGLGGPDLREDAQP